MSNPNNVPAEENHTTRKWFNWRGFFSLFLFLAFVLMAFSGVVLYAAPSCGVARQLDWTVLGIYKPQWKALHTTISLVVLIAAAFHLYYNWSVFWGYIKRRARAALNLKLEMAVALLVCVITVAGTLYMLPPFGTIVRWNADIREYWSRQAAAPAEAPVAAPPETEQAEPQPRDVGRGRGGEGRGMGPGGGGGRGMGGAGRRTDSQ